MTIASVLSTKGGPGKTTVTANLGAFCADAGIRTLLIDLDTQPSLSSFYRLEHEAPGGTYQLISQNDTRADQVISRTCIPNLSLILSNDPHNQLSNMLLYAADGRLNVTARHLFPLLDQSKFSVHCTREGQAMLFASASPDEKKITVYAHMQAIFDADGRIVTSLAELTRPGYATLSDDNVSRGCFCLPGLFMDCNGMKVPIHGIEYEVPFQVHTSRSLASTTSPYRLVIMDENDEPKQVLTDDDLKSYRFNEQRNKLP
ncbi:ParA family protein [Pseudomonas viridiflava]|uniref:ParA family protein n=1 Tax=Pseudomonas viridiflava TaxID=33069 RepID=UPI003D334FA1